jgi:hypothetical protein
MTTVLRDTVQTARKHYPCDACHAWLRSNYGKNDVTADEWLTVEGAQADRWKIRPGTDYRKVVYVDGGLYTYRARLDMDALCLKYELFDE